MFHFDLPQDLIAQEPSSKRDASRLMVLKRGSEQSPLHTHFFNIGEFLQPNDLLVLNNTKVFPARVQAQKSSGGKVELLFVEPIEAGLSSYGVTSLRSAGSAHASADLTSSHEKPAFTDTNVAIDPERFIDAQGPGEIWHALGRASRGLRAGTEVHLPQGKRAVVLRRLDEGGYHVLLEPSLRRPHLFTYLESVGEMPLPPYIDPEQAEQEHTQRYQTVYAEHTGAVAAPTAGLHFTPELLETLQAKGVNLAYVTLHVGLGTFLPVRVDDILSHKMHSETYVVPEETVALWKQTRASGGRVIAVGTTSLRSLEAATQESDAPVAGESATDIFIYPGYTFRAIDGLITNFHLPESTLMMLVAALHGREAILRAYNEAIEQKYRFYSYGDAMLIV